MLAPILVIFIGLGFFRIDHQSLWTDEIASINNAFYGKPLSGTPIWRSGHGPLYFLLLHFWMELGQTEFAVRSLSAIVGVAAVCLTYALGLRLVGAVSPRSQRSFSPLRRFLFGTVRTLVTLH